jgi:hypothetical protein
MVGMLQLLSETSLLLDGDIGGGLDPSANAEGTVVVDAGDGSDAAAGEATTDGAFFSTSAQ